ncbi:Cation/H(+) antiporter 20 [Linum grandiflorum]
MSLNISNIKTSSDGAWQGDNPLNSAFPLLILQTIIVLVITRSLAFILRPFRQPRVIAEILGGILLGPSALGRNEELFRLVFPSWSTPILESVASIGLLFFLFLVGLELDLASIRKSSKRAFAIALAGISLPFLFAAVISYFLRRAAAAARGSNQNHSPHDEPPYGQYLLFLGVALSITAFPVLARILAELKLLTTQVGQTAMAAAAFNDVVAWILLALAVALAGPSKGPLVSVWILLSGVGFVAFMLLVVRRGMEWIAKRCSSPSPQQAYADEAYICLTLAGVMAAGFTTDLIGIHSIFGAFVFGLTIPKGGEFAGRLMKRIEDFVAGLLLPLYFASSGLKTDVAKIQGAEAWGFLALVISTACAGKILGTFVVAMMCMIPARESLALGVLMNTKGLVELIVLNIGREKKVLNDEMFAILVLMALFTTFMTTPTVMAIYKPSSQARRRSPEQELQEHNPQPELRILACIHGSRNVPSLINLIDSATTAATKTALQIFAMQLVELTDRSSSIMMVHRARRNGLPFIDYCFTGAAPRPSSNERIESAFNAYCHASNVAVHNSTAISALHSMHEDICHVAEDKRVSLIILPFHKQWTAGDGGEGDEGVENVGNGWRVVNRRVLETAQCSVAVFVDRGFGGSRFDHLAAPKKVCVAFFGGEDDRAALKIGRGMADNPMISLTVIRFLNHDSQEIKNSLQLDEIRATIEYVEKEVEVGKEEETLVSTLRAKEFQLIVVGKGAKLGKLVEDHDQVENKELGIIGDILVSSAGIEASLLVIQHHDEEIMKGKGSIVVGESSV